MPAAVIENDIRALLESPLSGDEAPTLAHIEDALTTGYAATMALEASQSRLQRRIAEVAVALADDEGALPNPELKRLARDLKATRCSLVRMRTLLDCLRTRADAARAA
jgi:orotate phosphoribosyltransferase